MSYQTRQLAALVVENLDRIDISSVPQPDRRDIEELVHSIRHERAINDVLSLGRIKRRVQGAVSV